MVALGLEDGRGCLGEKRASASAVLVGLVDEVGSAKLRWKEVHGEAYRGSCL